MKTATIWVNEYCSTCKLATDLLKVEGISYQEYILDQNCTVEDLLAAVPSAKTVPQIFIGEQWVGGYLELQNYLKEKHVN